MDTWQDSQCNSARRSSEQNLSTSGITRGNPRLTLPPNSLDSHQNDKSWTDPGFSFPLVTPGMKMQIRHSSPLNQPAPTDDQSTPK